VHAGRVLLMSWTSGVYLACAHCGDKRPPRLTHEHWDAIDQVVIGRATCVNPKCEARFLYSRRLTLAEQRVPQVHLAPIRCFTSALATHKGE